MARNQGMGGMGGGMNEAVQGSELPKFGNDMMNGPLGQMMAMGMLMSRANIGQGMATQSPQGMVTQSYSSPFGTQSVNPQAEAQVAATKQQALNPIEIEKAVQQKQSEEANDSIMKGNAALNQLQYGASRFKALQASNRTAGTDPGYVQRGMGILGQASGAVGMNPNEQAWNEYTTTVATNLAASASPRTPTLLVDKYIHALGPANQTLQEFGSRVQNLVSEVHGRQMGYLGKPYNQDEADARTQQILAAPPAKDINSFFPKDTSDTGLPSNNPQATSPQMSPIPGMNPGNQVMSPAGQGTMRVIRLSDGKRGTIASSDFNSQKYAKV